MEFESQMLMSRDGVRIAYYDEGNSEGPVLVLSNGLGGNITAWTHLIRYFGKTHRIVSWDYRGLYQSGRSADLDGYTVENHVADLEDLVDHLDLNDLILVGWSMGVQVNFEYCRHRSEDVRAVVAINGTTGRPFRTFLGKELLDDVKETVMPLFLGIAQQHWEKVAFVGPLVAESRLVLKAMQKLGVIGSTADLEIFQNLARGFVSLDFGIYTRILEELGLHDASDVAEALDLPLLLIAGMDDPLTPASVFQALAESNSRAEMCMIPGATHYSPVEFPELVNLRIEKFLRESNK